MCHSFKFEAGGIENQKIKVTRTKELRKVLYTTDLLDSSSQRSKVLQSLFVIRLNPVDMTLHLIKAPVLFCVAIPGLSNVGVGSHL